MSPDDKVVLSGSLDGCVRLWHNSTGELIRTLVANGGSPCSHACFSLNCRFVLASTFRHPYRIWSLEKPTSYINLIPFPNRTIDGGKFKSGCTDESNRCDSSQSLLPDETIRREPSGVLGNPTGDFVYSCFWRDRACVPASDGNVHIWEGVSGFHEHVLSSLCHNESKITSVTSHPDKETRILATTSTKPSPSVVLWLYEHNSTSVS